MGIVIAIANQKGGVGKTTTAINLVSSLGVQNYSCLLIDIDPQANATSGLGIDPQNVRLTVYDFITEKEAVPDRLILKTAYEKVDLIPSHIDLVGAEVDMIHLSEREFQLRRLVEKLRDKYDFIIIDCAPSLGLLTVNALVASDSVLIPVQCEYFALEGLGKLLNTIKIVQQRLNTSLTIEGILLTMYDPRLRLSRQVVEEIQHHFDRVAFQTLIHRNTRLSEAPSYGKPVLYYDANSRGAQDYMNFATELLQRHNLPSPKAIVS
ncbi:MAG: ParA family protein [Bacteroidia bacterium]